jgi:hypothetical protein
MKDRVLDSNRKRLYTGDRSDVKKWLKENRDRPDFDKFDVLLGDKLITVRVAVYLRKY